MSHTWGIDLGTTNSCISRLLDGVPTAVAIDGSVIVPSVVLYGEQGVVVGRQARNLELSSPERCVRSVKRRMGRGPSYEIAGTTHTAEEVSAEILIALKRGAEHTTGLPVRDVVITVPAYFDDAQRRATLRAGELAGLQVLRLLNEPTSAALLYDQLGQSTDVQADPSEIVLIYDLGGGTFDVSVLEVASGVREVRATAGNTQLGGDDFDELLYRRFVDELKHSRAVDVFDVQADPRTRAKLRRLAEDTKIALSTQLEHVAREEFLAVDASGAPVHLALTVTRRELQDALRPMLQSTIELARRALDDARLGEQRLSRICLVGGSTRMPLVRQLLAESFDVDIHDEIDADLAVALGASVQAGLLAGEAVDRILVDVAAHSLGVLVVGDEDDGFSEPDTFAPVLRRNTVLPAEKREEFYTMVDQQERLKVDVYQGESRRCSDNRLVGSFDFALEPKLQNSPVAVVFAYDLDGVVRVTVTQPGTNNRKTVQLRLSDASSGLDSAVLRKARKLLADLEGEPHAALMQLMAAYEQADTNAREAAEEALLDFFVELDDLEPDATDEA
jgi:molecular chaperone DnaK